MPHSRVIRRLAIASSILLGLYLLGIASSALSLSACVRDSEMDNDDFLAGSRDGARAVRLQRKDLDDWLRSRRYDPSMLAPEYRMLARFVPLRELRPRSAGPVWTYAVGEVTPWPFVVRVDYGRLATFSYGPCGSVGTRMYVGFFGKPLFIRDWPTVMW